MGRRLALLPLPLLWAAASMAANNREDAFPVVSPLWFHFPRDDHDLQRHEKVQAVAHMPSLPMKLDDHVGDALRSSDRAHACPDGTTDCLHHGLTPNWEPTYNMSLSTILLPCDNDKLLSSGPNWASIRKFGIMAIGWSNAKQQWVNTDPMDCEELMLTQAELIKRDAPASHLWVYRNPVLAMPWMTSTRKIMNDPAYDRWFLHFKLGADNKSAIHHDNDGTYMNRVCDTTYSPPKCSELWHSQIQVMATKGANQSVSYPPDKTHKTWWQKSVNPDGTCTGKHCDCGRVPCGMYLFDHRQSNTKVCTDWGGCLTLREWFISNMTVTQTGLLSTDIDGFYIDDMWPKPTMAHGWPPIGAGAWDGGAGDVHGSEIIDCDLSFEDSTNIYTGWLANMQLLVKTIIERGGFLWQMFNGGQDTVWRAVSGCTNCSRFTQPEITRDSCAATLREACRPTSMQQLGALRYTVEMNKTCSDMNLDGCVVIDLHQHLASFLLMRGPWAWLGYAWVGCSRPYARPKEFDVDIGEPIGFCKETGPGIFERNWTKTKVKLDCNRWIGNVTPHVASPAASTTTSTTGTIVPKAVTLPLKIDEAIQAKGPPVPGPGCGRLNNPSPGPSCGRCLSSSNAFTWAKCGPGHDHCGHDRNESAGKLRFHIQDLSCHNSDTDFPFYDPTHGVYHLMYQRPSPKNASGQYKVAIGHVISRDLVHWSHMPVSLWPDHWYDSMDIFTGSATVVDGKPFLVYPGKSQHSMALSMAVPTDPTDPLLTNWTKDRVHGVDIAMNPIINGSSDDPSTAWKTAYGEWRLLTNGDPQQKNARGVHSNRTFAPIFAASNFTGQWHYVGDSNILAGECGSLFPRCVTFVLLNSVTERSARAYVETPFGVLRMFPKLNGMLWPIYTMPIMYRPSLYPGTSAAQQHGSLPSHVHKRGCGPSSTDSNTRANCMSGSSVNLNDHMTLGWWTDGLNATQPGSWTAAGPERSVDHGCLYAGKDLDDVPNKRRLFFGWITCTTAGAQTLARVLTYHPQLKQLVFSPAPEYTKLHAAGPPLVQLERTVLQAKSLLSLGGNEGSGVVAAAAAAADWNISFVRPHADATFGITFDLGNDVQGGQMTVFLNFTVGSSAAEVGVYDGPPQYPCPKGRDVLHLLPTDETLTIRVFTDAHVIETYWMNGRVAMVLPLKGPKAPAKPCVGASCHVSLYSSSGGVLAAATAWAMNDIWVTPEQVLATPRVSAAV